MKNKSSPNEDFVVDQQLFIWLPVNTYTYIHTYIHTQEKRLSQMEM